MSRCLSFLLLLMCAHAAPNDDPFPQPPSIKGLQVQMTEDALALGIHHAAININLSAVLGAGESFNEPYLASLDAQIRPLSEKGIVVYAILLAYPSQDARLLHPGAREGKGFTVAGFDSVTPPGRALLGRVTGMMAERWSGAHPQHGRVWGWIVGNEVNSHGPWYHVGRQPLGGVVRDYESAFRIIHGQIRQHSTHARLYVPFDHHWTASHGNDPLLAVPGRDFLDSFAALVKENGDLDWHVAWHPYASNLGNPRIWQDAEATASDDAGKVTFKNLEVLLWHLQRPELHWQGQPRRVILSEQGFHTLASPAGPDLQAAAYVYAWERLQTLSGIDTFIYHRHVDHAQEGGLALGLWTRAPDSIVTPLARKPIYDVFRAAGTDRWREASRPYRALIEGQSP